MPNFDFNFRSSKVHLFSPVLDKMLNSERGEVGDYLHRKGLLMQVAARRQVGKNTGRLAESIKIVHGRASFGQFITVGSNLRYALDHHEGTRPHIITPNNHEYLRFSKGGRVIYTKQVMHPGTRPNRYLSDQLYIARL